MGDILAGESARENIDALASSIDPPHVGDDGDSGPVTTEDGCGVPVVLARPREVESGVVEAEVESAAAGEEASNPHN